MTGSESDAIFAELLDVQDLFGDALRHHQAGRLAVAEQLYRLIVQVNCRHADAIHLLGVLAHQNGDPDRAVDQITQAIALNGFVPEFHRNLGLVLADLGRLGEAAASYRRALALKPDIADIYNGFGNVLKAGGRLDEAVVCYGRALVLKADYADAYNNLGVALKDQGKPDLAVESFQRALVHQADNADAHNNLGIVLRHQGKLDQAAASYRRAIDCEKNHAEAHYNLGEVLRDQGKLDEAVAAYERALIQKPNYADALNNLGVTLNDQGQRQAALAAYRRALACRPNAALACGNLGNVLQDLGQLDAAEAAYRQALACRPNFAEAYYNLGNVFRQQGRLDEAVAAFETALVHKPDLSEAKMNLAFAHLYRSDVGLAGVLARARAWGETHGTRVPWFAHERPGQTDRLPRIGFVSADFRRHAVGFLVVPAVEGLARAGYHVTCYSNSTKSDSLTARFVQAAAIWRPVAALSDDALAEVIRADGIDILIDLSGYTAGNRLHVFARKPAPIQVACWVGYPATSGLAAMDYILADRHQLPPGTERFYTEAVVRLPDSYVAFEPPPDAPAVGDLPALSRGWITFGSFNMLEKITEEVVAVWSRVLLRLPTSRLLLKTLALGCAATQRRYKALFADHGIAEERLELMGATPLAEHLSWMQRTDIALDSFPYAGGRTTLEALWMGLPVIALPRETFGSRHSLSYLATIGLGGLAASDADHYVDLAVALASDPARLAAMRSGLRARMLASPLCDAERFTGDLAGALTGMWHRWCTGEPAMSFDVG